MCRTLAERNCVKEMCTTAVCVCVCVVDWVGRRGRVVSSGLNSALPALRVLLLLISVLFLFLFRFFRCRCHCCFFFFFWVCVCVCLLCAWLLVWGTVTVTCRRPVLLFSRRHAMHTRKGGGAGEEEKHCALMVRVKAKARKGDDAFQTRKQKVGRKKLAPATATRAEVHARTLRVTTSSAIAREALRDAAVDGQGCRREKRQQMLSPEQVHADFKEHLCGTSHYKKNMRAAAFTALARALTISREVMGATKTNLTAAASGAAGGDGMILSPLEVLYAFTAALNAMTDTDDDVRRAALVTLKTILQPSFGASSRSCADETVLDRHNMGAGDGLGVDIDQVRAALRVVDVTLTHAMMSVRRTGVELLHLVLQVHPAAVRVVLDESEVWVKMAIRVSSIVMPGSSSSGGSGMAAKVIYVFPCLLETMLQQSTDVYNGDNAYFGRQDGSEKDNERRDPDNIAVPLQILHLFDECAPKWSMAWRELMELRGSLFRDTEQLQRATAIARVFACVSTYLREHQLLKRTHVQLMQHLFAVKVPFTMQELVSSKRSSITGIGCGGIKARMELANAIADACLPVAASSTTDNVWQTLRDFLSLSIRSTMNASPQSAPAFVGSSSNSKAGRGVHLLGPLRTLQSAVVRFPESLLPRLLFLVPQLMQAITLSVSSIDSSAWATALLATADVFSTLLTSHVAASSPDGIGFLAKAVLALPRLLFAIRGHDDAALVDRVVFAFLRSLWHVVSSGHPLLQYTSSSAAAAAAGCGGATVAAQLRVSLPSIFELRVPDRDTPGEQMTVDGVLHRCSDRTVELAVHVLFYLGADAPRTSLGRVSVVPAFPALASDLPAPSSSPPPPCE